MLCLLIVLLAIQVALLPVPVHVLVAYYSSRRPQGASTTVCGGSPQENEQSATVLSRRLVIKAHTARHTHARTHHTDSSLMHRRMGHQRQEGFDAVSEIPLLSWLAGAARSPAVRFVTSWLSLWLHLYGPLHSLCVFCNWRVLHDHIACTCHFFPSSPESSAVPSFRYESRVSGCQLFQYTTLVPH